MRKTEPANMGVKTLVKGTPMDIGKLLSKPKEYHTDHEQILTATFNIGKSGLSIDANCKVNDNPPLYVKECGDQTFIFWYVPEKRTLHNVEQQDPENMSVLTSIQHWYLGGN